jgi:hypothetical protein
MYIKNIYYVININMFQQIDNNFYVFIKKSDLIIIINIK